MYIKPFVREQIKLPKKSDKLPLGTEHEAAFAQVIA